MPHLKATPPDRLSASETTLDLRGAETQMTRTTLLASGATLAIGIATGALLAQQQPQGPQPFFVGNRLGLPINPAADGAFEAMSSNVKVYGSVYSAESCSYDPERGVIVVPNRGVPQTVQANNSWITFL